VFLHSRREGNLRTRIRQDQIRSAAILILVLHPWLNSGVDGEDMVKKGVAGSTSWTRMMTDASVSVSAIFVLFSTEK
jgi:hypothetical protein